MKKVLNGKLYNTDTARELASYSNDGSWRDFRHYEETLYRKNTGEYFIHGVGGPMTRYAQSEGTGWTGGERIVPLTIEAARQWAEENLSADDYESIFGEIKEDETRVMATYSLDASTVERLKRASAERGVQQSALVNELINKGLC
jgi:hypothetical protein